MRLANLTVMTVAGETLWSGTLRDFLYRNGYSFSERRDLCRRLRDDARGTYTGGRPCPTFEGGGASGASTLVLHEAH